MCFTVYIIADHPLARVEDDPAYPGISVTVPMPEVMEKVRSVVPGEHVVEVMTSEGCGCGFVVESRDELEADLQGVRDEDFCRFVREEWEKHCTWVGSIFAYITKAVAGQALKVYIAWADEEGFPISKEFAVTPAFFDGPPFTFGDDDGSHRLLYHVNVDEGVS